MRFHSLRGRLASARKILRQGNLRAREEYRCRCSAASATQAMTRTRDTRNVHWIVWRGALSRVIEGHAARSQITLSIARHGMGSFIVRGRSSFASRDGRCATTRVVLRFDARLAIMLDGTRATRINMPRMLVVRPRQEQRWLAKFLKFVTIITSEGLGGSSR
jgi:hypothetical protein